MRLWVILGWIWTKWWNKLIVREPYLIVESYSHYFDNSCLLWLLLFHLWIFIFFSFFICQLVIFNMWRLLYSRTWGLKMDKSSLLVQQWLHMFQIKTSKIIFGINTFVDRKKACHVSNLEIYEHYGAIWIWQFLCLGYQTHRAQMCL